MRQQLVAFREGGRSPRCVRASCLRSAPVSLDRLPEQVHASWPPVAGLCWAPGGTDVGVSSPWAFRLSLLPSPQDLGLFGRFGFFCSVLVVPFQVPWKQIGSPFEGSS